MNRLAHVERKRSTNSRREPLNASEVSVAEGYERWAPAYDSAPNPLLAREERHFLPVLPQLRAKRVLDLACGTGRWLEKLMEHGAELGVGVDRSMAMLRVARNKCSTTRRLARSACASLPFRDAAFDLAICSFALGHMQNLREVARELARVAEPGADVLIGDLHPEAYSQGWRVGFRDSGAAVEIELWPRSVEEIVQTFRAEGFECLAGESLWLGEPERPIFARAGRLHVFAECCRVPAVFVCQLRHRESRGGNKQHRDDLFRAATASDRYEAR